MCVMGNAEVEGKEPVLRVNTGLSCLMPDVMVREKKPVGRVGPVQQQTGRLSACANHVAW